MIAKPRTFDELAHELIVRAQLSATYDETDTEYRDRVVAHLLTLEERVKADRRKRFWHGWQILAVALAGIAVGVALRLLGL